LKITLPWLRQAATQTRSNAPLQKSFFRFEREFEFREFSNVEAPVAFKWRAIEIRSLEERLWRRVFARKENHSKRFSASVEVETLLPRDVIIDALKRNEGFRFMTDTYINIDKGRQDPNPVSRYKHFAWTDDPLEQIGINAWHSDVVLIDGEFWIACPCPSYAVDGDRVFPVTVAFPKLSQTGFFERGEDKLGEVSRVRRPFDERGEAGVLSLHFGVDEFDHAVGIARSGVFTSGKRATDETRVPKDDLSVDATRIETLMPQCVVPTAFAAAAMAEAFSMFMDAISLTSDRSVRWVSQFDANALHGLACVQEVAFGRRAADVDPDDLADAVEECLDHLSRSSLDIAPSLRLLMATSIARTRNRAVDMSFL
jgi:hypothetical protein